jgi:hypothetical protein
MSGSASELVSFATSMLTALYGAGSVQVKAFLDGSAAISKGNPSNAAFNLFGYAKGAISNAVAEIEGGLIGNLRTQVAGEVLSELVGLGKEMLRDNTESAKNVSTVLVAAAFEDLIRRMGQELAGIKGRPSLHELTTALKDFGILRGGEVGTAQSFLKFRNDSLHADWANVSRAQVESCTGFVEAMLLKHFS